MNVLIDANLLLDVLQKREPHYREASLIWKLCETDQITGYVLTLTFANLVYIMRKELSPEKIEEVLRNLMLIFQFAELTPADLVHGAKAKWGDFEDAVQSAAAERIHADYILTRNIRDFKTSRVMALTPAEFLARWQFRRNLQL